METHWLNGKDVWAWRAGGEPIRTAVIVLQDASFAEDLLAVEGRLSEDADRAFALVGFGPVDWNRGFTPWPAPGLGKEPFAGEARGTLDWMTGSLVPWMRQRYGQAEIALLGYSLAGLMALWSCYESDAFSGCASCSGSLWYDGFLDYMAARRFPRPVRAYLSLGEAERKARNPRLARVGGATRAAADILRADPHVTETVLRWHPGGHFSDPAGRMADALAWLLRGGHAATP